MVNHLCLSAGAIVIKYELASDKDFGGSKEIIETLGSIMP